jgi:hypothetical protein
MLFAVAGGMINESATTAGAALARPRVGRIGSFHDWWKNAGMKIELPVVIERQPNYTTCGPTSLHALYTYFRDDITLEQVISEVHQHETGGTVSIHLALHALRRGYQATMWVSNVHYWDPTWFKRKTDLGAKLRARFEAKGWLGKERFDLALDAIEEYLRLGGKVTWGDLTPERIAKVLARGLPILAGTNGVYLYQCARETETGPNDITGDAYGHFMVVCGYDPKDESVSVADPLWDNPAHGSKYYRASVYRLIGAIFLGASSDDANCLVIHPKGWKYRAPVPRRGTRTKAGVVRRKRHK